MTTIKPNVLPPELTNMPKAAMDRGAQATVQQEQSERAGATERSPAALFKRHDSAFHRLAVAAKRDVEVAEQSRIETVRKSVENGEYRPNLGTVAERLLVDLKASRN